MSPVTFYQTMAFLPRAEFFLTVDDVVVKSWDLLPASGGAVECAAPHDGVRPRIVLEGKQSCRALMGNYTRRYIASYLMPAIRAKGYLKGGQVLGISLTGREGLRPADGTFEVKGVGDEYGIYSKAMGDMLKAHDERLPLMLDATVGLIWTILDGQARVLSHEWTADSLVYKTLSNGWLRAYPLMSMTFGLARWACLAVEQSKGSVDHVTPVLSLVPRAEIERAITTGNRTLARTLWAAIQSEVVSGMLPASFGNLPLRPDYLPAFNHFLDKGVSHWFNHDIMAHWSTLPDGHGRGWESYLTAVVDRDRKGETPLVNGPYGYVAPGVQPGPGLVIHPATVVQPLRALDATEIQRLLASQGGRIAVPATIIPIMTRGVVNLGRDYPAPTPEPLRHPTIDRLAHDHATR